MMSPPVTRRMVRRTSAEGGGGVAGGMVVHDDDVVGAEQLGVAEHEARIDVHGGEQAGVDDLAGVGPVVGVAGEEGEVLLVVVEVRVYRPGDGDDFVEVGEGAPGEGAEDGFAVDVDGGDGDAGQVDVAYLVDGADAGPRIFSFADAGLLPAPESSSQPQTDP